MFLVTIPDTKTKKPRSFAITGPFFNIVERYASLRPLHANTNRFFLNFQKGKCTIQTIGRNKFYKMPGRIAAFLNLTDADSYTGNASHIDKQKQLK